MTKTVKLMFVGACLVVDLVSAATVVTDFPTIKDVSNVKVYEGTGEVVWCNMIYPNFHANDYRSGDLRYNGRRIDSLGPLEKKAVEN